MVQVIAGVVLGVCMSVIAGMVIFCIWYEKAHPEILDQYRRGTECGEVDAVW